MDDQSNDQIPVSLEFDITKKIEFDTVVKSMYSFGSDNRNTDNNNNSNIKQSEYSVTKNIVYKEILQNWVH